MEIIDITPHREKYSGIFSGLSSLREVLKNIIARIRMKRIHTSPELKQCINLPKDLTSSRSVLIAVPEDMVDAILSLPDIMDILEMNSGSGTAILCEEEVLPVFGGMNLIDTLYVYKNNEALKHKHLWFEMGRRLSSDRFDIVYLLSHNPGNMLKYLITATLARVRVAFASAAGFPCCNLRIRNNGRSSITDILLSKGERHRIEWDLSEGKSKETALLFREQNLEGKERICGIDLSLLNTKGFARKNLEKLVEEFENINYNIYLYSFEGLDVEWKWIEKLKRPMFSGLSIAGTAAVVRRSSLIICPAGVFAAIAFISGVNTIMLGDGNKERYGFYSRDDFRIMEVKRFGTQEISSVIEVLEEFDKTEYKRRAIQ